MEDKLQLIGRFISHCAFELALDGVKDGVWTTSLIEKWSYLTLTLFHTRRIHVLSQC